MISEADAREAARHLAVCRERLSKLDKEDVEFKHVARDMDNHAWRLACFAVDELAQREAERAEMESMLRGLLKTFDDADLERLAEVYERDEEAEKWKSEDDMYGWNFHKGAAAGCTTASIIFFRVKREIERKISALKGGAT